MKRKIKFALSIRVVFFGIKSIGAQITWRDLEDFVYKQSIYASKDIPLPDPVPPEEGITSGAVFILGRYLPPPYEVSVDGVHVLINGVPCNQFNRLKKKTDAEERGERELDNEIKKVTEYQILDVSKKEKGRRGHKEIIVSVLHPEAGEFKIEVEGLTAERDWLEDEVKKDLYEKTFELMD